MGTWPPDFENGESQHYPLPPTFQWEKNQKKVDFSMEAKYAHVEIWLLKKFSALYLNKISQESLALGNTIIIYVFIMSESQALVSYSGLVRTNW